MSGIHNPSLKIQMCVIDQIHVNACAVGRHTIAVTKGAILTLSEEQLKAIIGHEIGHIANGDTMAKLFFLVGNGIFSLIILIVKALITMVDIAAQVVDKNKIVSFFIMLYRFVLLTILLSCSFIIDIFIALTSRENEFKADEYSHKLGYGYELTEALYLLEQISLSDKRSIIEKLQASHPILPKRIANLESIQDGKRPLRWLNLY